MSLWFCFVLRTVEKLINWMSDLGKKIYIANSINRLNGLKLNSSM